MKTLLSGMETLLRWLSTNRLFLRAMYYPWILLPYSMRRVVTAVGIWWILLWKRAMGIERREHLTSPNKMFTLSYWGVPRVSPATYALQIDGSVRSPLTLTLAELKSYPAVERQVTLDCVGGLRNNSIMRGVSFAYLLERAEPGEEVKTAVFYCADGYYTTHPLEDLIQDEAFMAYAVNGQEVPAYGYPLRLVAPGKYGYKWAKWVVRIELVPGSPKGYWEQRGVPDRARVGDMR